MSSLWSSRRLAFGIAVFLLALPAAAAERWQARPSLSVGRNFFALVPLPSGDLLAPGGVIPTPGYTNRVDLFSVAGRTFTETTAMPTSHRYQFQAVLLGNGKVLIAGEQYDGDFKLSHLSRNPRTPGRRPSTNRRSTASPRPWSSCRTARCSI